MSLLIGRNALCCEIIGLLVKNGNKFDHNQCDQVTYAWVLSTLCSKYIRKPLINGFYDNSRKPISNRIVTWECMPKLTENCSYNASSFPRKCSPFFLQKFRKIASKRHFPVPRNSLLNFSEKKELIFLSHFQRFVLDVRIFFRAQN